MKSLALERIQNIGWFVVVAVGLASAGVWTNVMGASAELLPDVSRTAFGASSFSIGRMVVGVALILLARTVQEVWRSIAGMTSIIIVAATGFAVIAPHQTLLDAAALCSACIFLGSMCYTVLTTSFYMLLSYARKISAAAAAIAASLLAELVVTNRVLEGGSFVADAYAVMVSSVLLGACLMVAFAKSPGGVPHCDRTEEEGRLSFRACLPVCRLLIYTVALVCIKALSDVGAWGMNRGYYLGVESVSSSEMLVICLLVAAMAAVVFVVPVPRLSMQVRSILGFAMVLAGLQILALGGDIAFGRIFDLVTVSCESFAHLLMWVTFIECILTVPIPPFRLTGIRSVVYVLASILLSMVSNAGIASSTVVMVAIYGLFLLLVLTLVAGGYTGRGPVEVVDAVVDVDEGAARINAFVERYGLSGKEREILILLLGGAKRSDIEHTLGMSEGTVRTHISRMYRKLDVHSKGELENLVSKE